MQKHDLETSINGSLALVGANLRLTHHAESFTSFRMPNNDPHATEILHLKGCRFTGKAPALV
jgi:hypothetical protein